MPNSYRKITRFPSIKFEKLLGDQRSRSGVFHGFFVLFLGMLMLLSCTSCQTKPSIPQEKMVPLMADVLRLEASQQVEYNYMTLSDSLWNLNYAFVLKKHQIDSTDFKNTLEFYKRNPTEFSDLMGKVIDELQEEEIKRFRR